MTSCVYRIECLDPEIKDIYIGSTVDLKERIKVHKHHCKNSNSPKHNYKVYTCIRENGGWDNWRIDIELLATGYDKETRLEWEQNYIDCLKPQLNTQNAKSDRKEYEKQYYLDNKEKIKEHVKSDKRKEYEKQYRLDNKEKIKEKAKCLDCGIEMLKTSISRHIRLKRCKGKKIKVI